MRAPSEIMLASLCARARRAVSSFQQSAQRTPRIAVRRNRLAISRTAEHDPALAAAARHRVRGRPDEVRVITGLG